MKKIFQFLIIFSTGFSLFGQVNNDLFLNVNSEESEAVELSLNGAYTLLNPNTDYWTRLLETHPQELTVSVTLGEELITLNLAKVNLIKNNLKIRTSSGNDVIYNQVSKSVFYQGAIEGHENSHFALSILNNEIIGVGSIPGIGDVNLGKLPNADQYIFYSEAALDHGNPLACGVVDNYEDEMWDEGFTPAGARDDRSFGDCVGVYLEIDEDIYLDKGGVIGASDYLIALFNEVTILYETDGIGVYISDIFVWEVESPYDGIASTSELLELFGTTTEVWTGDVGHFISYRGGGGIAWVDILCNDNQYYRKAVSDINSTFEEVPVYSWTIEVFSHEMGHNLGSPHTHACFWNGDMTAIDGCGPEAGYFEGCDAPLPPSGTIMSYCHLVGGVGIDLGLGFGDQPAELMQGKILDADCLGPCPVEPVIDAAAMFANISSLTCEGDLIESELVIQNNGDEDLVSLDIYVMLDGDFEEAIDWTGTLVTGASETVSITPFTIGVGAHTLTVEVANPNGELDMVVDNDEFEIDFEVTTYPVLEIASVTDISCFGEADGAIDVSVSAGTPDFDYSWDNGAGDEQDAAGLGENTYTLTVTDAEGCITEISQEIIEPVEIEATATITIEVLGSDGGINVTITGGAPGYTYSWSNGEETEDISGLEAGVYTLTVTDENGCTKDFDFVVDSQLGIQNYTSNGFELYPNPATDAVTITNNNQLQIISVRLYNSLGQVVFVDEKRSTSNYTMDVSEMANGVYYFVLNTQNQLQTMKLIIE